MRIDLARVSEGGDFAVEMKVKMNMDLTLQITDFRPPSLYRKVLSMFGDLVWGIEGGDKDGG